MRSPKKNLYVSNLSVPMIIYVSLRIWSDGKKLSQHLALKITRIRDNLWLFKIKEGIVRINDKYKCRLGILKLLQECIL